MTDAPIALPTPEQLATADPEDLRSMLTTDRSLAAYFSARADVVAEALARRARPEPAVPTAMVPTAMLPVAEVVKRSGMSKGWLYREARANRLPFARRIGRRIVFDERGLQRWLDSRAR